MSTTVGVIANWYCTGSPAHHFEKFVWAGTTEVPCKECGAPAYRKRLRKRNATVTARERSFVFRSVGPDGKPVYRYPAREKETPAGYERVEFESIRDMERHAKETGAVNDLLGYDSGRIDEAIDTDDGTSDPDLAGADAD